MTGNKNILTNTRKEETDICFADGTTITSTLIGQFKGKINGHEITLHEVLYIPIFKRNLMSINHLTNSNYKIVFHKEKSNNVKCATIFYNKGNRIYKSISNGANVYRILTSKSNISTNFNDAVCYSIDKAIEDKNLNLWHRRYGHANIDLIKDKLINIDIKKKCKVCSCSKLKNFPFPRAENKSKEPFELIHMDLASAPDFSIHGNKYFLTIVDDYTRYGWVLFTKDKASVYNTFLYWYKMIKNIFNKNIKFIKSDNGS